LQHRCAGRDGDCFCGALRHLPPACWPLIEIGIGCELIRWPGCFAGLAWPWPSAGPERHGRRGLFDRRGTPVLLGGLLGSLGRAAWPRVAVPRIGGGSSPSVLAVMSLGRVDAEWWGSPVVGAAVVCWAAFIARVVAGEKTAPTLRSSTPWEGRPRPASPDGRADAVSFCMGLVVEFPRRCVQALPWSLACVFLVMFAGRGRLDGAGGFVWVRPFGTGARKRPLWGLGPAARGGCDSPIGDFRGPPARRNVFPGALDCRPWPWGLVLDGVASSRALALVGPWGRRLRPDKHTGSAGAHGPYS